MKKIIATAAALVLTLAMSVTAFAAPSVVNTTDTSNGQTTTVGSVTYYRNYQAIAATAVDANGNAVNVVVTPLTAAQRTEAMQAVQAEFGDAVDVLGAADYDVTGASESNPITLTFTSSVVNAGDSVCIYHKHADGSWYREAATAGDGKVTATFTSFSPMVIVRTATAATTTTTAGSTDGAYDKYWTAASTTSSSTSPKTGDNGVAGAVAVAVVCAGALVLVSRKKTA